MRILRIASIHRAWILGLLVIAGLIWIVLGSQSFQSCINNTNNQADKQSLQERIPILSSYRDCLGVFIDTNQAAITALSTTLIALFTLTLWGSTRQLWLAGEIQARRELRAYVAVMPGWLNNIDPNLRMRGGFWTINGGKTPAHRAEQAAVMRIEQHPLPPNFVFPNLAAIPRVSRNVIAPNIQCVGYIVADQNFTQTQIIEILQGPTQGDRRLYIFGQIDYVDAFEEPRMTQFCISSQGSDVLVPLAQQGNWAAIAKTISQPGFIWGFEFASQHNEST